MDVEYLVDIIIQEIDFQFIMRILKNIEMNVMIMMYLSEKQILFVIFNVITNLYAFETFISYIIQIFFIIIQLSNCQVIRVELLTKMIKIFMMNQNLNLNQKAKKIKNDLNSLSLKILLKDESVWINKNRNLKKKLIFRIC